MSQPQANENLNAVQMFPFVAVLLCTMGSLLVLLVAVASNSREQAVELAQVERARAAAEAVAAAPELEALRQQKAQADEFVGKMNEVHAAASATLQDDQRRLSHIEEHIRRLHDQLGLLQIAASELNAKEGEHYDDRAQAERELERLQQLIAESQSTIRQLATEGGSKKRSIAILPSENERGTRRVPIYVECRRDGVFLQPEGIKFMPQDFMGQLGAKSPLAVALRAAREHIVQKNPELGKSQDTEPYVLVVVRPEGLLAFQLVCETIHAAGLDFGYELIDSEWDLRYPTPDPRLASVESQAVSLARDHIERLAAAAPRMYGGDETWEDSYVDASDEVYDEETGGGGGMGGGEGNGHGGAPAGAFVGHYHQVETAEGEVRRGDGSGAAGTAGGIQGAPERGRIAGKPGIIPTVPADGGTGTPEGQAANPDGGPTADGTSQPQNKSNGCGDQKRNLLAEKAPPGSERADNQDFVTGDVTNKLLPKPVPVDPDEEREEPPGRPRGKDWAIKRPPNTVPIRRTIHVIVRDNRLAILPEPNTDAPGREIELRGSTGANVDQFVRQLKSHMNEWGIAGQGLSWRPVLELQVGPDGQRRADDIARLLKDSGIEVRTSVAQQTGEPARASR
jgi:Skp family chaperone for outer membrane proteins